VGRIGNNFATCSGKDRLPAFRAELFFRFKTASLTTLVGWHMLGALPLSRQAKFVYIDWLFSHAAILDSNAFPASKKSRLRMLLRSPSNFRFKVRLSFNARKKLA
jgi:hypothetical protein